MLRRQDTVERRQRQGGQQVEAMLEGGDGTSLASNLHGSTSARQDNNVNLQGDSKVEGRGCTLVMQQLQTSINYQTPATSLGTTSGNNIFL